jgi:hypothetical protein
MQQLSWESKRALVDTGIPCTPFQIVIGDADLIAALADPAKVQEFVDAGFGVVVGESSVTFVFVNEALESYVQTGKPYFASIITSILPALDGDAIVDAYVHTTLYLSRKNSSDSCSCSIQTFIKNM